MSVPPYGTPSQKTYKVLSLLSYTKCSASRFTAIADSAIAYICKGVKQIFRTENTLLINGTFWDNIVNKVGLDLINAGGLVDSALYKRRVITDLLLPLLRRITHAASMTLTPSNVDPHALQYYSILQSQMQTEKRKHRRGREFTSPPMKWRDGVCSCKTDMYMYICVSTRKFGMSADEKWAQYFGQDMRSTTEAVACQTQQKHPFTLPICQIYDIYTAYTTLKKQVESLKKEFGKFREAVSQQTLPGPRAKRPRVQCERGGTNTCQ